MRKIKIIALLGGVALAGCSVLFNGDKYEGDGGDREDAGTVPACDANGDECCSNNSECSTHVAGPVCRQSFLQCGCDSPSDCLGHDSGHVCEGGICGCRSNADCNDMYACDSTGLCRPDGDGDGFLSLTYETDPARIDCDDRNGAVYPGAPPVCGSSRHEDCMPAWGQLETDLGASEIGVSEVLAVDLPADADVTDLSVAAVGGGEFYLLAMRGAGPQLFHRPVGMLPDRVAFPPTSSCVTGVAAATIGLRRRLPNAELMIAFAGSGPSGQVAVETATHRAGSWSMGTCEEDSDISPTARPLAIALAPAAGLAAALWSTAAAANTLLWTSPATGIPEHTITDSFSPWLSGSQRFIAAQRNNESYIINLRGETVVTELDVLGSSVNRNGAFVTSPRPANPDPYLYLASGGASDNRLVRGTCDENSCTMASRVAGPPLFPHPALANIGTHAVLVQIGPGTPPEIHLTGLPYAPDAVGTPLALPRTSTPRVSQVAASGLPGELVVAYADDEGVRVQIIKICASQ